MLECCNVAMLEGNPIIPRFIVALKVITDLSFIVKVAASH
jgi:hypothetical protein